MVVCVIRPEWGYAQREGINYNEVFSSVMKHSSIRILLALAAQYDYELDQLDVKTAFLHGDLEEEIYMTQPLRFKVAGKKKLVCKLENGLVGRSHVRSQKGKKTW